MNLQPHLQIENQDDTFKAIIVGDPNRVDKIAALLKNPVLLAYNREFKTMTGRYNNERILVTSTGIGSPSTIIALEELINIGIREIVRVGSCGAMTKTFMPGEIMVATGAVRDEHSTEDYVPTEYPAIPDPYLLKRAMSQNDIPYRLGIIRSHNGFYYEKNSEVEHYWSRHNVLGADLETSSLYVLGSLKKVKVLSILNNVVPFGDELKEGVNQLVSGEEILHQGEKNSILLALNILTGGIRNE
ncbi:nucleoside phosphorylase [Vagococcus vulneris]|uniref:Uridine phosphorylase n=1 Tax=Vagococcus vulneris TaxID=1977869 RepID=A0A429ZWK9_9ENTE|nr:nucleoside phosphorylase [Vagococcus vulneris]RST98131.1 uridine phosphorylase [Vagococcus vulneris]